MSTQQEPETRKPKYKHRSYTQRIKALQNDIAINEQRIVKFEENLHVAEKRLTRSKESLAKKQEALVDLINRQKLAAKRDQGQTKPSYAKLKAKFNAQANKDVLKQQEQSIDELIRQINVEGYNDL